MTTPTPPEEATGPRAWTRHVLRQLSRTHPDMAFTDVSGNPLPLDEHGVPLLDKHGLPIPAQTPTERRPRMTDPNHEPAHRPRVSQLGTDIDTVAPPLQPAPPTSAASAEPAPWDTVVAAVARAGQHDNTAGDDLLAQIRNHRGGWLTVQDDGALTDDTGMPVDADGQATTGEAVR